MNIAQLQKSSSPLPYIHEFCSCDIKVYHKEEVRRNKSALIVQQIIQPYYD